MSYTYSSPSGRISKFDIKLLDIYQGVTGTVIYQLRPKSSCNPRPDVADLGVDCSKGFGYTLSPICVLNFICSPDEPFLSPELCVEVGMLSSRSRKAPRRDAPEIFPDSRACRAKIYVDVIPNQSSEGGTVYVKNLELQPYCGSWNSIVDAVLGCFCLDTDHIVRIVG